MSILFKIIPQVFLGYYQFSWNLMSIASGEKMHSENFIIILLSKQKCLDTREKERSLFVKIWVVVKSGQVAKV